MRKILVTGATGFVGTQLCDRLEADGYDVIGATRHQDDASRRHPARRYRHLDVQDIDSTTTALEGMESAVYLVHSMGDQEDFAAAEEEAARNFARAALARGLKRIVYLGGVQPERNPSQHLASRKRVGEVLRAGGVACIELQASMIIGAGSESFTIVRDLAARLPVLLLPAWSSTLTEPIAIQDILSALAHALTMPCTESAKFSVPGPEALSVADILKRTARVLGVEHRAWDVPFVTPHLSSFAIAALTRADNAVSRELVEGLTSDLLASETALWSKWPEYVLTPFDDAVRSAVLEDEASLHPVARYGEALVQSLASSLGSSSDAAERPPSGARETRS